MDRTDGARAEMRAGETWRVAARFVGPLRAQFAAVLALTLIAAGAAAAEPLLLKAIFDGLDGGAPSVAGDLAVLAALALGREAVSAAADWAMWRARLSLQHALLDAAVQKLHGMPLHRQRAEGTGALMTRLDRAIQGFVGGASQLLFQTLPGLFFLVLAAAAMLQLDWRLALIVLVFAPAPALIAALASPEQMARERKLTDRWVAIYGRFNEVLSGLLVVRSFAAEEREKRRFLDGVAEANALVASGVARDAGFGAASNAVVAAARIAALAGGAGFVAGGEMSIGTLAAFLGYAAGLFGPVQGLSGVYQTARRAQVGLEEIVRLLSTPDHIGDAPDARDLSAPQGRVVFENVSFRYAAGGPKLLDGVTLSAAPGETVAIVGPSGAGKSTLMALLMRFYDPDEGRVTLDGHDLRALKQGSLRRCMGAVLQEPLLFNESVRANIAYGRPSATDAEIEAAARAAGAHAFVMALPAGYDTRVGERGGLLSGGERQRLTIARALLKDPRVLILDEATASLDAETEHEVQEALLRLSEGRTTFVIAHRLATVATADRIVVLKAGRIAEQGTHGELIRRGGVYADLVRRQSGGALGAQAA